MRPGKDCEAAAAFYGLRPSPLVAVAANTIRSQPEPSYADYHQDQESQAADDRAAHS
jgi:hypothetical protein